MRHKTILVVDDHAPTRQAYSEFLSGCGYTVMEARHGGEAIMLVRGNRPDVVLLDLVMPVLGGVETAESLREYGSTAHIRIIGVTACDSWEEQERMRRVCDELLLKPCAPEHIAERIRALVGHAPEVSPRAAPPAFPRPPGRSCAPLF